MESIWTKTTSKNEKHKELNSNIKTDVLIIGGGMCGILCAYMLQRAGVDYALVEANRICQGVTSGTTAKITLQHGLVYDKLINTYGFDKAKMYLEANQRAMEKYEELCQEIDCNFEKKDSYVYSTTNREKIEREIEALNRLGVKADFLDTLPIPLEIAGAVKVKDQAQFNPLKFANEISRDLNIYENTRVTELMPNKAITERGEISCKKIIVASHFPILNKHGGYFLKMYQHRSYGIALKNAQNVNGMYVDENEKGLSFRNYEDMLLLIGAGHRTGKKTRGWRELEEFAKEKYPNSQVVSRWATQDCMSLDSVPYIGRYSNKTEDLYVATGFNKWGMTSSMVSSMILCDLIQGKKNQHSPVFYPSRSIIHPQLCVNALESILGLITPTVPRCPHLGCALKYNKQEHSWDCSCHGSRFDENGKVLNNPANCDKRKIGKK